MKPLRISVHVDATGHGTTHIADLDISNHVVAMQYETDPMRGSFASIKLANIEIDAEGKANLVAELVGIDLEDIRLARIIRESAAEVEREK